MARFLNKSWLLVVVLVVAFVVRLGAAVWWQSRLAGPDALAFGDSESYWALGRTVADGQPYQFGSPDARVFRTPGYPAVLATVFLIAGDDPPVLWARGVGAALGTATVAGVYCLGRQLFDPAVGMLAAAMAAVYPGAIAASVFVLSEAAFCPLMVAQLLLAIAALRQESSARAAAWSSTAGCTAALATLVRPSWLLFTPFAAALSLVVGPDRRRLAVVGAASLAGLCVVMAPWWIRNARVTGRFVPTTLQVGASMYDGLSPTADGSSDMAFVADFTARERARPAPADGDVFEHRLDRAMRDAAVDWATAHPGRALLLAAVKFVRMWNVWPNEAEFRSWPLRAAVCLTYVPLAALGLWGVWRYTRFGWPYAVCWLPAVYLTLLHVVFVSSIRYREPAMLPGMALAAAVVLSTPPRMQAPLNKEVHDPLARS